MAVPDIVSPNPSVGSAPSASALHKTVRIELWDWPIRVFHWSLLLAVTTAIVTGELGGSWMEIHGKAGITIVGLIAFRLVWGFIGSTTSRFAHFLPSPSQILAYLQGRWQGIGHNPLGALSVVALLTLLALQAGSGLFSNDDIAFAGPLATLVSEELAQKLTAWHHQLAYGLFALLALHVAAIVFYGKVKKDKLVKPMVTGQKDVPAGTAPPTRARPIAIFLAIAVGLLAAIGASGIWIKVDPPQAPVKQEGTAPAW